MHVSHCKHIPVYFRHQQLGMKGQYGLVSNAPWGVLCVYMCVYLQLYVQVLIHICWFCILGENKFTKNRKSGGKHSSKISIWTKTVISGYCSEHISSTQRSALQSGTELHPLAQTTQTHTLPLWHSPHYTHSLHYTHITGLCNRSRWLGVSVSQTVHLKFHTPDSYTEMRLHTADCAILLLVCLHVCRKILSIQCWT